MNGTIFLALGGLLAAALPGADDPPPGGSWTEQMLAPALRSGDVVILDNLAAHKVAGVRDAIQARGAELLYLPPYSPDLNPIEQAFAKLKALLRKAAKRNVHALCTTIGSLLERFLAAECANYLANAGYSRSA